MGREFVMLAVIVAAFLSGWGFAKWQGRGRDANALLAVGFTITDPEGYEVGRFDE